MQIPPFLPYISVKQCLLLLFLTSMHSNRIRTAHLLTDGDCFMTPPFMAPPLRHPTSWNPLHSIPLSWHPLFHENPLDGTPRYHSPEWTPWVASLGWNPTALIEPHSLDGTTPWMETPLNVKTLLCPKLRLRVVILVT